MAYKRNWFSNFVQMDEPLVEGGAAYWTVENYYQAMKTLNEIHRKQIAGMSAAEAKKAGRKVELRPDWEEVKLSVMEEALRHKFKKGTSQYKKLMATGSEELVEWNYWHDNYWGQCTCSKCAGRKGQNILGKILMQIRSEHAQQEKGDELLKITVRNKKTYRGPGEYVGRGSVLGNRFEMKNKSDEERRRVIQEFKVWLWKQMQANNKEVMNELYRLLGLALEGELNLICWCAPEACHADIIAAAIKYLNRKMEEEKQKTLARVLKDRNVD